MDLPGNMSIVAASITSSMRKRGIPHLVQGAAGIMNAYISIFLETYMSGYVLMLS